MPPSIEHTMSIAIYTYTVHVDHVQSRAKFPTYDAAKIVYDAAIAAPSVTHVQMDRTIMSRAGTRVEVMTRWSAK